MYQNKADWQDRPRRGYVYYIDQKQDFTNQSHHAHCLLRSIYRFVCLLWQYTTQPSTCKSPPKPVHAHDHTRQSSSDDQKANKPDLGHSNPMGFSIYIPHLTPAITKKKERVVNSAAYSKHHFLFPSSLCLYFEASRSGDALFLFCSIPGMLGSSLCDLLMHLRRRPQCSGMTFFVRSQDPHPHDRKEWTLTLGPELIFQRGVEGKCVLSILSYFLYSVSCTYVWLSLQNYILTLDIDILRSNITKIDVS